MFAHLRGDITLGTYLLDQESKARFIILDADDDQGWERLGHLARVLVEQNVPAYLEKSRRGSHLWLFLAQAAAGREARDFGQGLLATHQVDGVRLFPKQDQLGEGSGSLIRMPFGVHRLTGQRYGFYTADGFLLAPTIREQIQALSAPKTIPEAAFEAYRSYVSVEPVQADLTLVLFHITNLEFFNRLQRPDLAACKAKNRQNSRLERFLTPFWKPIAPVGDRSKVKVCFVK